MSSTETIYQLKVSLIKIQPEIWRRIQVPDNYTFADLHLAVQVAMGWLNIQLHEFKVKNPRTNMMEYITNKDIEMNWTPMNKSIIKVDEAKVKIKDYFVSVHDRVIYEYDFRDGWIHSISLEKILAVNAAVKYPIIIDGKRACPIEECGGVKGYEKILNIVQNPSHKDYNTCLNNLRMQGYLNFNPDAFKFNKKTLYVGILDQKEITEFFDFLL